jgi:glucosamine-6-phosphate deaminase
MIMKIIKVKNYDEMSQVAASYIIDKVNEHPNLILGLATGGTPKGTYRYMIENHQNNGTTYRKVTSFNLDEYIGLSENHPNSYRQYMNESLFKHIDILKSQTNIPNGETSDPEKECNRYEQLMEDHGGIDLQILGLGGNGHIGFNEPGTKFGSKTHIVKLTPSTREANARFFNSLEEVPKHAITMGISSIMKSREIVLLVSGDSKKEAMKQLICGEVSESFPASILQLHPNVTIIADEKALMEANDYCGKELDRDDR